MNLLFNDTLSPITSNIGFLETDVETAANAYKEWMDPILTNCAKLEIRFLKGQLKKVLLELQPLVSPVHTKSLFVPTEGKWSAFFDNGWQGADPSSPMSVLAERMGCRGISISAVPNTMPSDVKTYSRGRYGATMMEIFGQGGEFLRTIYSTNDGGKWVFGESGDSFEFEDLSLYKVKRIRDRFTPEILATYLSNLGVDAFNEAFYIPETSNNSIMLERIGKLPAEHKEYSLREVREYY